MATCIKYDEDSIQMDVRKPIYEDMINCLLPVLYIILYSTNFGHSCVHL
jgi:hypothetical protein